MHHFFVERELITDEGILLTDSNYNHAVNVLRLREGERIIISDPDGVDYMCSVEEICREARGGTGPYLRAAVGEICEENHELPAEVVLFQCLPKSDKMELIIQKAVELGVTEIVPVISARCISRPDTKSLARKTERWNKIALQSAQQSRRGIIPCVRPTVTFSQAVETLSEKDCNIIFYECGGKRTGEILPPDVEKINIFIGSEGGFEEKEVSQVIARGGTPATLGRRVLRCETAPLCAVSIIMYLTDNA